MGVSTLDEDLRLAQATSAVVEVTLNTGEFLRGGIVEVDLHERTVMLSNSQHPGGQPVRVIDIDHIDMFVVTPTPWAG